MKTIIFIGTNKSGSSREAISAAKKLGYYTILLTNNPKQIKQKNEYPDVFLMKLTDLENYQEMKEIIRGLFLNGFKIRLITSFVEGRCGVANKLAKDFNLNHFSIEAIYKMENKLNSRKSIQESVFSPNFRCLNPNKIYSKDEIEKILPAIIKSPKSAASRDVYKVDNYPDFNDKYNLLKSKNPEDAILLEEYLDGPQYIAEVLVIDGKANIVAIIKQEISYLSNHFIVTGYSLETSKPKDYHNLSLAVSKIINLHQMEFGACHLEMRLINNHWKLIEVNPRISGGAMNQLIKYGTGINLVEETLKLLLGRKINIQAKHKKPIYVKYLVSEKEGILIRVTGKQDALNSKNVLAVYIKPRKGNKISLPHSMGNRYAYVIATGSNNDEARRYATDALKKINLDIK